MDYIFLKIISSGNLGKNKRQKKMKIFKIASLVIFILLSCEKDITIPLINDTPIVNPGIKLGSDYQIVEKYEFIKLFMETNDKVDKTTIERISINLNKEKDYNGMEISDTLRIFEMKEGWNTFYAKFEFKNGDFCTDSLKVFCTTTEKIFSIDKKIYDFNISNDCKTAVICLAYFSFHQLFKLDIATKQITMIPRLGYGCNHYATFSPDDKFIVISGSGSSAHKIDIETLNFETLSEQTYIYPNVAFYPSGEKFLTAGLIPNIYEYSLKEKKLELFDEEVCQNVAINNSGTEYATSFSKKDLTEVIKIHDLNTKTVKKEYLLKSRVDIIYNTELLTYSKNGKWLFDFYSNSLINLQTDKVYRIKLNKGRNNYEDKNLVNDYGFLMQNDSGVIYSEISGYKSILVLLKLKQFFETVFNN